MFEFYLAGAELAFRRGGHMVFQIQLAREVDAVPLTRDYMLHAAHGGGAGASSGVVPLIHRYPQAKPCRANRGTGYAGPP